MVGSTRPIDSVQRVFRLETGTGHPKLGIEPMRGAGLNEGQQIKVLPDPDEFAVTHLAHQDDRQRKLCTRSWLVRR